MIRVEVKEEETQIKLLAEADGGIEYTVNTKKLEKTGKRAVIL